MRVKFTRRIDGGERDFFRTDREVLLESDSISENLIKTMLDQEFERITIGDQPYQVWGVIPRIFKDETAIYGKSLGFVDVKTNDSYLEVVVYETK